MRYNPLYGIHSRSNPSTDIPQEFLDENLENVWASATTEAPSFTIASWNASSPEQQTVMLEAARAAMLGDTAAFDGLVSMMVDASASSVSSQNDEGLGFELPEVLTELNESSDDIEVPFAPEIESEGGDVEVGGDVETPLTNLEIASLVMEDVLQSAFPFMAIKGTELELVASRAYSYLLDQHMMSGLNEDAILGAIQMYKLIAFPEYSPEELTSTIYYAGEGNNEILSAEMIAVVSDDSRDDALCSPKNRALILNAFGESAAARFDDLCLAAPESRLLEIERNQGSLAATLGIDEALFDQFVVETFDFGIDNALFQVRNSTQFDDAISQTVKHIQEGGHAREISNIRETSQRVEGGTKATSATTQKVVAGAAVVGTIGALAYFIHRVNREV